MQTGLGRDIEKHPFNQYVELADQGRNGFWWIVLGSLIALGVWIIVTLTVYFGAIALLIIADPTLDISTAIEPALTGRVGATVILTSIGGFWLGVRLALRLVHRRAFVSIYGSTLRIDWPDLWRGCVAGLLVSVVTLLPFLTVTDTGLVAGISFGQWLIWLIPMAILILLQTSAEEVFFRGYLMQALAHRFRSPLIWFALPLVSFTAMHWYPDASGPINIAVMITIGAFAASAALLLFLTGNLGASIGIHWGTNLAAFLLVSADEDIGSIALATSVPIDDPAWTTGAAVQLAILGIFSALATVWLLVHPRSP